MRAIDSLPDIRAENLDGIYLEVAGRRDEPFNFKSLDSSGLKLLRYSEPGRYGSQDDRATVFATERGIKALRKKVDQFINEDTPIKIKEDGSQSGGRPKNANLVQSIAAITEAGLRALWQSPPDKFPDGRGEQEWELWLDRNESNAFIGAAGQLGVSFSEDQLKFPEDVVVIARASQEVLAQVIRRKAGVRALAAPSVTTDFFDGMDVEEQAEWVDELSARTEPIRPDDPGYVTLLDTGISRAHPLINPFLTVDDRHAASPAWGLGDINGHGTQLAGLALYGDLSVALESNDPVQISHRLESVKLLPDAGINPHHLLGAITRNGVNAVEVNHPRRRAFVLANSTDQDTPHDGAPTSWSSEVDQLCAGASGRQAVSRLMIVAAGNTDNMTFGNHDYLSRCDALDNEIESPAQSWNAITVGAYTKKTVLPPGDPTTPLAPFGDLSPSSRTASWSSHWPLKPDIVFEGGNWAVSAHPPPMRHAPLSLLTTSHNYPLRSFTTTQDTSAAAALAAKAAAELWTDYPDMWPETVRALLVSSARWTPQMLSHFPVAPQKSDYTALFQRYGYGIPDLERAKRSAANAFTLIVEDTITPYRISDNGRDAVHNEMKMFTLPWPVAALRALGNTPITLRIALSTFISPNPSEPSRGSKFRYASHNLRFKLNRAGENAAQFEARISKAAQKPPGPQNDESDGWDFGSNRRDVGSLQLDQLTCKASDLARRNLLAVHPVTGWWKSKHLLEEELPSPRFSLVVEIDAGEATAQLYAEVQTAITALVAAEAVIAV